MPILRAPEVSDPLLTWITRNPGEATQHFRWLAGISNLKIVHDEAPEGGGGKASINLAPDGNVTLRLPFRYPAGKLPATLPTDAPLPTVIATLNRIIEGEHAVQNSKI